MWPILFCLLLSLANSAGGSELPNECFELFRQVRQQKILIPFIHNKIVLSLTPGEKLSTIDLLAFSISGVSLSLLNSTAFSISASPLPLSTLD
jgi:hypothetical protein